MKVKSSKTKAKLVPEDIYGAILSGIEYLPLGAPTPKKVGEMFELDIRDDTDKAVAMKREVPANLDTNSPLRADIQAILDRALLPNEIDDGFELDSLKGKKCRVVVAHRGGPGGKLQAVITAVLPPENEAATPAAQ